MKKLEQYLAPETSVEEIYISNKKGDKLKVYQIKPLICKSRFVILIIRNGVYG
jgi:hypothetical protein